MKAYLVSNAASGDVYGVYVGATVEEAVAAMAEDAGHRGPVSPHVKAEEVDVGPRALRTLCLEAGAAGDVAMIDAILAAVGGDGEAMALVAIAILDAKAMAGDKG